MTDLFLFAILLALAFLAALQDSFIMLPLGVLGALLGRASGELLMIIYPWWTPQMSLVIVVALFIGGLWGISHRHESAPFIAAVIGGIGAAGLLTVILLPLLVSVFSSLPLSDYANTLFIGTSVELYWSVGAFIAFVFGSRMSS